MAEKFGFIGGGNMGEAMIRGLISSGLARAEEIVVSDPLPARCDYLHEQYGIVRVDGNEAVLKEAGLVVLAIKPQNADLVLDEVRDLATPDHLLVSIMAGVTLDRIQQSLVSPVPVIRVMPNTPALVLAGAAALAPGAYANETHMARARALFESVGLAVVVEEKYMDVVTGLSGSGPAYVFVLLEALADGAVRQGLPHDQAKKLAAQTVLGAARLALDSDRHTGALKDMVTSPGGTTAAGLYALEKGGFRALVMDAVGAATARSAELGKK
ncbi:MAG: pyrroline-5-carboxylate reductase [Proteobacteria bacterium]|nr:pyrroline-5-carboxylate reductase [Pseudomonadota bacterium]